MAEKNKNQNFESRLYDTKWDTMLAGRVVRERQKQLGRRRLVFASLLVLVTTAVVFAGWSINEDNASARMTAMLDDIEYSGLGSAFSE